MKFITFEIDQLDSMSEIQYSLGVILEHQIDPKENFMDKIETLKSLVKLSKFQIHLKDLTYNKFVKPLDSILNWLVSPHIPDIKHGFYQTIFTKSL